ncbi:MAG: peptide/nickel transport system permease protein [Planctomycetota bacterium]|jgi:peptide/nickel transport system permease protein
MNLKFLRSRGAKKFFKNRLATFSLFVIGIYFCIGLAVLFFNVISESETLQRVGPDSTPMWGEQKAEKRLRDADFHLARLEKAIGKKVDQESAIANLALAERKIADISPEDLTLQIKAAWEVYEGLAEQKDDMEFDVFDAKKKELKESGIEDKAEIQRLANVASEAAVAELINGEEFLAGLTDLEAKVDDLFAPLVGWDAWLYDLRTSMGTDRQGRSISIRAIFSIKIALQIGLVSALISVIFGSILGAAAAFYGGLIDHLVVWLYSTFSSIPSLIFLIVISYRFVGTEYESSLMPVYVAFCLTFWIGPCRIVRGEVLKIKELEYVQAATSVGFGKFYILMKHVIPNTMHLMFINFSLLFIGAIKSEVILSFLGLGVKNQPSWGIMIRDAVPEVVNGFFPQIGAATAFMFVLVISFNILSDALQDAFDPKHVS